jgi:hypothetical protein
LNDLISKVGSRSLADPWRLLVDPGLHYSALDSRIILGASVVLALLLWWRLPAGPADLPAVRPALAGCLGWLITSPVQHPWYDAMLFPLLALMSPSWLDGLLIARGIVAGLDYLPGVAETGTPPWLDGWVDKIYIPWLAPIALDSIIVIIVVLCLWARPRGGRVGGDVIA